MKKSLVPSFLVLLIISGLFLIACSPFIAAQNTTPTTSTLDSALVAWNRTYSSRLAQSIIQTTDGGYAISGSAASNGGQDDFWLLKVDSLGNIQWNKTYGGPAEERAECILQTADGGYALAGNTADSFWLVKTDETGSMEWNKTYRGTGSSSAHSLIQTRDGGFVLAGDTNFVPTYGGVIWLVKTDSLGNVQWNKTCGGSGAQSVIQTIDGGYAVAGYVGSGMPNFYLAKTDSYGDVEWSNNYGSADKDAAFSVVQCSDGGYAVGGSMWLRSNEVGFNIAIIKTDSDGNINWTKYYDAGMGWSMIKTSDGGFAITGTKFVETDSDGDELLSLDFDVAHSGVYHQAYSVVQIFDGGFAVAGVTGGGDTSSAAWLAKINPTLSLPTAQPTSPSPKQITTPEPTQTSTPFHSPSLMPLTSPSASVPEFPIWIIVLIALASILVLVCKRKWNRKRIETRH